MRQIAQATWECADPGMQFDTTINHWHTAANTGRINGSNPCSEYMHLDNSACNLASINLLKFLDDDGTFDVESFEHAVEIFFTAQEIIVGNADYPTEAIGENSRRFRQLGLGYANLGAMLMALGLPYDSDGGRAWAGAITALMTGHAYATSARTAARMGPFAGYTENEEHMLRVLDQHRAEAAKIDEELVPSELLSAAQRSWDDACDVAADFGVRNSQASVLAPTGTIGLMMDCDTTGVEPDLGLVKLKKLVGGGTMSIVNQTIPRALRNLEYTESEIDQIIAYIDEHKTILGAPNLTHRSSARVRLLDGRQRHPLPRAREDDGRGAAVHLGRHLQDREHARGRERRRRRAVAHRCLAARHQGRRRVPRQLQGGPAARDGEEGRRGRAMRRARPHRWSSGSSRRSSASPSRTKLARTRASRTFEFRVADCKGFVTVGEYEDGRPGEIFVRVSKQGSTLAGIMDAFAISVSHGLQYGVPLRSFVEAFTGMRFEPAGMTDDEDIRIANSLMDYLFRKLAVMYLSQEERAELNILTTEERMQPTLPGVEETVVETRQGSELPADPPSIESASTLFEHEPATTTTEIRHSDAPMCMQCGVQMIRAGSCHACPSCGTTSGCS